MVAHSPLCTPTGYCTEWPAEWPANQGIPNTKWLETRVQEWCGPQGHVRVTGPTTHRLPTRGRVVVVGPPATHRHPSRAGITTLANLDDPPIPSFSAGPSFWLGRAGVCLICPARQPHDPRPLLTRCEHFL